MAVLTMALLTMALLTFALLTMALLTMALLTMALLTMALLTMALLTHCCHTLTTALPTMVQADFAAYGIALTFTPCALREVARRAATQGTGAT